MPVQVQDVAVDRRQFGSQAQKMFRVKVIKVSSQLLYSVAELGIHINENQAISSHQPGWNELRKPNRKIKQGLAVVCAGLGAEVLLKDFDCLGKLFGERSNEVSRNLDTKRIF